MSKRYSIFLTALFCAFLGGMALLSLLLPKDSFSELDNPYLQKTPTLSFSSVVVNGKFMEEAEDYVSDHIAGRDFWVALKAWSERLSGKGENEGVYFGKEDTLLNRVADPDEERLSQAMNYLNRLAGQSEVPTYFGVIPTSSAIWRDRLPKGAPTADEESVIRELNGGSQAAVVDIYDALAAHAGDENVFHVVLHSPIHSASPPLIAPNRQAEAQTPQPTQWVGSMTARVFPPPVEAWDRAGQPTWRQALQPVQASGSTVRAGLCLTSLSRAQGRLEMTREGSSTASSCSTARRVPSMSKGSTVTTRRMPMA